MKISKAIAFITITILLYSCSNQNQKSKVSFINENEIEISVDSKWLVPIKCQISDTIFNTSIHLVFQNLRTKKILVFNFDGNSLKLMPDVKYKINTYFCNLFILSTDSIYSLQNNTNNLILQNNLGKILKTYHVPKIYTPVTNPSILLIGDDHCLLLGNASKRIDFGEREERLKYYKNVKPLLKVNIKDSTFIYHTVGKFPEKYEKTGYNYEDPCPSACFGSNNTICVSFGADDNLYLYNDSGLTLQKKVKSNYIKEFRPYPDDKKLDMLFLKNYISEEPKYLSIIFSPWQNLYYRIVKHRMHLKSQKSNVEKFWSVIVIDQALNVIGEKEFSYKFNPRIFIPTPFGILMARSAKSDNEKTVFVLMKIIKDE